jgi:hypothetical protein
MVKGFRANASFLKSYFRPLEILLMLISGPSARTVNIFTVVIYKLKFYPSLIFGKVELGVFTGKVLIIKLV